MLGHFFDGHASQFSLSGKEIIGVELSVLILASADKLKISNLIVGENSLTCVVSCLPTQEFLFNELFIILRKLQERIKRENGQMTAQQYSRTGFFRQCLEFNMDQFDPSRMTLDACFGQEIRDISSRGWNGKGLITGWKESSSSGTDKEDLH
ncbi:hypothetical protein DKX38_012763 [Salix brachista]|uniref:Uncharacterized protein n=1 Tax=Salix brachista TaxID=2182728 RepID=A0A5N5LRC8_9ROSI|nr:hypothetical protein DKX38_012763 [Salix brachista]